MTLCAGNVLAKVRLKDGKWELVDGEMQRTFLVLQVPNPYVNDAGKNCLYPTLMELE